MASSEFEILPARPSEERYREIMTACFGRPPNAEYFAWKYANNPAGKVVAFEALFEGQLAGFYGVIPWYLTLAGKTMRVFQSMDTMTHPSFQRRGLFVKLAMATYSELVARDKDHVIIGVPGSTSFPGFVQKLGWTHVFDSQYIFKPRAFIRSKAERGCVVRRVTAMDPIVERYLAGRTHSSQHLQVSMDPSFLEWRVFKNPASSYETLLVESSSEPIGLAVVTPPKEGRVFLDLLDCSSDDLWSKVIGAVIAHLFERSGISFVYTWRPTDAQRARAFSRAMFFGNPFRRGPFSYRVPFIVRSATSTLGGLSLTDASSFDLQPLVQD